MEGEAPGLVDPKPFNRVSMVRTDPLRVAEVGLSSLTPNQMLSTQGDKYPPGLLVTPVVTPGA